MLRVTWAIAAVIAFFALSTELLAGSPIHLRAGGIRITRAVDSFHEIRQSKVVRQGWDSSCGAAALVTVLKHQLGAAVDENTVVLSMLANTDPAKVRAQGGFSLLDLKRFAEAIGYKATGYSGLTIDDLAAFDTPVIVPVRIRGYDHFIVFRGAAGGRVLVADPATGNVTMTIKRFMEIWGSSIGFVVGSEDAPDRGNRMAPAEMDMTVPDLNYVSRVIRNVRPFPLTRRARVVVR